MSDIERSEALLPITVATIERIFTFVDALANGYYDSIEDAVEAARKAVEEAASIIEEARQ